MYYKCHIQANYFVYIEEKLHDRMSEGAEVWRLVVGWMNDKLIPCVLIDEQDIPENRIWKMERTGRFNGIPTKAELKPTKE